MALSYNRVLLSACLLLLAGTVPLRAQDRAALCEDTAAPFFSATIRGALRIYFPARPGAILTEFVMPRPPDVKRVFVAGDAVAVLLAGSGREIAGEENVEVLNAGMADYNSGRVLDVVREVASFQPDLVVIMSGHNDSPRMEPCPDLSTSLMTRLRRFSPAYRKVPPQTRDALIAEDLYEKNLEKMAAALKPTGARVVFCTLPSNIRDMAPGVSFFPDNREMAAALIRYERGDFKGAMADFAALASSLPARAAGNYYMAGKAALAAGERAAARKYFSMALDTDWVGGRSTGRRNEAVRRVAAKYGAAVADLEADLLKRLVDASPGDQIFYDAVRWHRSFTPYFSALVGSASGMDGDEQAYAAAFSAGLKGSSGPEESAAVFVEMLSRCDEFRQGGQLSEPVMSGLEYLRNHAPGLLNERLSVLRNTRAFVDELSVSKQMRGHERLAKRIDLLWPFWLAHLGELHRRHREYAEAVACFDEALKLAPDYAFVRVYRGWAQALAGNRTAAEADFANLPDSLRRGGDNLRALLLPR